VIGEREEKGGKQSHPGVGEKMSWILWKGTLSERRRALQLKARDLDLLLTAIPAKRTQNQEELQVETGSRGNRKGCLYSSGSRNAPGKGPEEDIEKQSEGEKVRKNCEFVIHD